MGVGIDVRALGEKVGETSKFRKEAGASRLQTTVEVEAQWSSVVQSNFVSNWVETNWRCSRFLRSVMKKLSFHVI